MEMVAGEWPLFLAWFSRFGARPDGLDAAEQEADEENERRRKYGLINLWTMKGDAFPLGEALEHIGRIFDFKFQSDVANEAEGKPRFNMVKATRAYFEKHAQSKAEAQARLVRLCVALREHHATHARVHDFCVIAGMTEVSKWTERSACFYLTFLEELKKLHAPGDEARVEALDTEQPWAIFAPWLGTADVRIPRTMVLQAFEAAQESPFGFGDTAEVDAALAPAAVQGVPDEISLLEAARAVLQVWFGQLAQAQVALKELFHANDENGDEELEIHEFLALLKSTPMKIRQHDAMNMFSELAGPDGTMDESEFSELLTFYKFNTRDLLAEVPNLVSNLMSSRA